MAGSPPICRASPTSASLRVSADAALEGAAQRDAAAPVDGFLADAPAARLAEGAVLARLADLKPEALRRRSEYAGLRQERRAAMAELDRAEVALLAARLEPAEARLARTEIVAPIAGVLVSGDLSQRLDPPSRGAWSSTRSRPKDSRVAIEAPERDLRHVDPGQTGRLLLATRADAALPHEVTRVTSVAEAVKGAKLFRIAAAPTESVPALRPGIEGVAKIEVEPRPILQVRTRGLIDWLRLFVWEWTP